MRSTPPSTRARAGALIGEVVAAGEAALAEWTRPQYPDHWGHGLGMGWEPPFLLPGSSERLEAGMTLAIERGVRSASASAYLEHDILVTESLPESSTPRLCGPS